MTNDGRAFFTTDDALVHGDTNEAQDVYEYVDGRPQLITPGTGDTQRGRTACFAASSAARAASGSAPTAPTSTSRPSTPWSARTTTASSSSSTTPAPAAASRSRRRRRPATPPTSATAPAARRPSALGERHRRRPRRRRQRRQPATTHGTRSTTSATSVAQHRRHRGRAATGGRGAMTPEAAALRARRDRCVAVGCSAARRRALPRRTRRSPPSRRVPSTTQAGGHPDLEVQFTVENRFLRHSQSACNCEDAKDATVHLPPGSSATPTRPRSARSPSSPPTPARSTRRSASSTSSPAAASPFNARRLQPGSAARRRRPARLQDLPLRHAAVHGSERPHRQRLRPRRDGHLDLPRRPSRWRPSSRFSGGCRPTRATTPAARPGSQPERTRSHCLSSAELCDANGPLSTERSEHDPQALRLSRHIPADPLQQPAHPVPAEPDHLRRPAQLLARRPLLRRRHRPRRIALAADDRLRPAQLQPQPLRAADHQRRPTPPRGSTSTSASPSS